ncbi:uncharacterized protein SCODWIG_01383 [Saccharomycodes ludwigii]|uniref:Uncharacterized protein n=1 Tax=Saccharomycodes ludwigii TaxID=36035 RepID=A0A376B4S1_9ASCO|nr:hypothetical protein SCDLUD_004882 [Saccharomycodes ludwigii]KAH3899439.1 hypothetical protein SCDLUD_004882 [Saccharomycodes ludwigii]SSD59622.1 uncharacterized protein SCODWIG_01383 [Saccharomycodes ludwigii]
MNISSVVSTDFSGDKSYTAFKEDNFTNYLLNNCIAYTLSSGVLLIQDENNEDDKNNLTTATSPILLFNCSQINSINDSNQNIFQQNDYISNYVSLNNNTLFLSQNFLLDVKQNLNIPDIQRDNFSNSSVVVAFILAVVCVGGWMVILILLMLPTREKYDFQHNSDHSDTMKTNFFTNDNDDDTKSYYKNRLRKSTNHFVKNTSSVATENISSTSNSTTGKLSNTHSNLFYFYVLYFAITHTIILKLSDKKVFYQQYINNYQDVGEFVSLVINSTWYKILILFNTLLQDLCWFELIYHMNFYKTPKFKRKFKKKVITAISFILIIIHIIFYSLHCFYSHVAENTTIGFVNYDELTGLDFILKILKYSIDIFIFTCFTVLGIFPYVYKSYQELTLQNSFEKSNVSIDTSDYNGPFITAIVPNKFFVHNLPLLIYNVLIIGIVFCLEFNTLITLIFVEETKKMSNWMEILTSFIKLIVTVNMWALIGMIESQQRLYNKWSVVGKKIDESDNGTALFINNNNRTAKNGTISGLINGVTEFSGRVNTYNLFRPPSSIKNNVAKILPNPLQKGGKRTLSALPRLITESKILNINQRNSENIRNNVDYNVEGTSNIGDREKSSEKENEAAAKGQEVDDIKVKIIHHAMAHNLSDCEEDEEAKYSINDSMNTGLKYQLEEKKLNFMLKMKNLGTHKETK